MIKKKEEKAQINNVVRGERVIIMDGVGSAPMWGGVTVS